MASNSLSWADSATPKEFQVQEKIIKRSNVYKKLLLKRMNEKSDSSLQG